MSGRPRGASNPSQRTAGSPFTYAYVAWTSEAMLAHHRKRTGVYYFPVIDRDETRRDKIDGVVENRFDLNHETHVLPNPIHWLDNPSDDLEWQILLHKFYYAVGLGIAFRETRDRRYLQTWIRLTSSWMDTVQDDYLRGTSLLNHELFVAVTGRRIQNWIYAHYFFVTREGADDLPAAFHNRFLKSIRDQVNYLIRHVAPARNHRTIDLYAIFLAATVFPEFEDAAEWLEFSRRELFVNMRTDLLSDGVQCELSSDYHHLVLRNYLCMRLLAKLNAIAIPDEIDDVLRKALAFSLHIHKPDGNIPALSDGDVRSYRDVLRLGDWLFDDPTLRYVATGGREGQPPAQRSAGFPVAGYYTLRSGWGACEPYAHERYLVFDCGPLGEGNHGHFDLLNIEVAAFGRSLVVDPARYTYNESGPVNWRVRFRSTAYHNTVTVDGRNQTAYQPGKRKYKIKGPAPEYALHAFDSAPDFDYLHGVARSHEYDAVHERKILFSVPEYWIIVDRLTAAQQHSYDLRFHLGPEDRQRVVQSHTDGTQLVRAPHLVLAHLAEPDLKVAVEDGFVSRRYGNKQLAPVVRYTRRARDTTFATLLYPYRDEPPTIHMRRLSASADDASAGQAEAFRMALQAGGTHYTDVCFVAPDQTRKTWRFGDYRYNGHYLLLRLAGDGTVVRLHMSSGAMLEASGRPVRLGERAI